MKKTSEPAKSELELENRNTFATNLKEQMPRRVTHDQ